MYRHAALHTQPCPPHFLSRPVPLPGDLGSISLPGNQYFTAPPRGPGRFEACSPVSTCRAAAPSKARLQRRLPRGEFPARFLHEAATGRVAPHFLIPHPSAGSESFKTRICAPSAQGLRCLADGPQCVLQGLGKVPHSFTCGLLGVAMDRCIPAGLSH